MIKVKVNISADKNVQKLPHGSRLLLRRACNAVLQTERFPDNAEVNIIIVDDERIREMNRSFRNIDSATDVLSFPLGENGVYDTNPETGYKMLGEIVISYPHALRQAKEYNHTIQREMAFLTVHSMLHLLGYDHTDGENRAAEMRAKEEEVLLSLGESRDKPYEEI